MADFLKALSSGRVLLMDGAMGTELQRLGLPQDACCEDWNLTHPEAVRAVHRSYVEAGARILVSNTFQANTEVLARHGRERELPDIVAAGVAIARLAAPPEGWVLASIGPAPAIALMSIPRLLEMCQEADGILLETFSDQGQATLVTRAAQERLPAKPILVSFTFDGQTLRTFTGESADNCAWAAEDMGAAALGVNCGRDLTVEACAEILRRYRRGTRLPLFARPNAGTPKSDGAYSHSPEEMASQLPALLEAGAAMIGGCCGTTPDHIRAFRDVLKH